MTGPALRLSRGEKLSVVVASLAATLGQWAVMFVQSEHTGFGDWQMVHHHWEAGHVAMTRFGEFPLWDPYQCGGVTLLGNPEAPTYSPFFLLSLLVGTLLAQKLTVVLHAWAAYVGVYLLARLDHGLRPAACALAAVTFAGGGYFAWQIGGGHATFLPFYFTPWLLMAWRRAATDARGVIATAALLALTVMEGGTYPFPYFALLLGFETVTRLLAPGGERSESLTIRLGVLRAVVLGALLTLLLGAVRFVPILETLSRFPRTIESHDYLRWHEFWDVWARAEYPTWRHPPHPYVWVEYTAYIGAPLLIVCLSGLPVALWRRRGGAVFGFLASVAVMAGAFHEYAPWTLLHHLPIFDSLRLPSRFSVVATAYLALLGAYAADQLFAWSERVIIADEATPIRRALHALLMAGAVAAVAYQGYAWGVEVTSTKWNGPPLEEVAEPGPYQLISPAEYPRHIASMGRRNQGTTACYVGNMNWQVARALWAGPTPQARLLTPRAGALRDITRTQHTISLTAALTSDAEVLLNQNHDPHWEASVGETHDLHGALALRLPAGEHEVTLRYAPPTFWPSALASLLGLILALLWWGIAARAAHEDERRAEALATPPEDA